MNSAQGPTAKGRAEFYRQRAEFHRQRVEAGLAYITVGSGGVSRDARLSEADRERARSALADATATAAGRLPWAEAAGGLRVLDRHADGPHYPREIRVGEHLVAAFTDSWVLEQLEQSEEHLANEVVSHIERSGIEGYFKRHADPGEAS